MPVYSTIQPVEGCHIGIWKIEEGLDTLLQEVELNEADAERLNNFKSDRRKIEWLSVRALLKNFTASSLKYSANGKPALQGDESNISISHTRGWVAIAMNETAKNGVDVETVSSKAYRIREKFVHAKEELKLADENELWTYYTLLWASKEALYKKYSEECSLEFKSEIRVAPFKLDTWYGEFEAQVNINEDWLVEKMGFISKNGVVLVFTLKV